MKTIASVAIAALESASENLSKDTYKNLFAAWYAMRCFTDGKLVLVSDWLETVKRLYNELIERYKHGEKNRELWAETFNIRVSVSIMGGYKDYPCWEVAVSVSITDHTDKNTRYTA